MNQAHFHLVLNHLPIVFPIVGLIVLIGGLFLKSEIVKRTAYAIFVLGAISAFPAGFSGGAAEEFLEHTTLIDHDMMEHHEWWAAVFSRSFYGLGLLCALGLWASIKGKSYRSIIPILVTLYSIIILFLAMKAGSTGGEIRHIEIRPGFDINKLDQPKSDHVEDKDND